jgi:hypothetical protein
MTALKESQFLPGESRQQRKDELRNHPAIFTRADSADNGANEVDLMARTDA